MSKRGKRRSKKRAKAIRDISDRICDSDDDNESTAAAVDDSSDEEDLAVVVPEKSQQSVFSPEMQKKVELVAAHFMRELKHQSEKDLPRTQFAQGITKHDAMLKGCEEQGILLLILLVMSSTAGSATLFCSTNNPAIDPDIYSRLLGTIEIMVGFEEFLEIKRPLSSNDIANVRIYIPAMLERFKETVDRQTGMGLKIVKFHMILHIIWDILRHGLPANYDSGPGEARHKEHVKKPAKQTQKRFDKFDRQIAKNVAMAVVAEYACDQLLTETHIPHQILPIPCWQMQGPIALISRDDLQIRKSKENKSQFTYDSFPEYAKAAIQFLRDAVIRPGHDSILVFSEVRNGANNYRAHPDYRSGGTWYDWGMVKFPGNDDDLYPCRFCCFFKVETLPTDAHSNVLPIVFDNNEFISTPGMYAICQSFENGPYKRTSPGRPPKRTQHPEIRTMFAERLSEGYWPVNIECIQGPCAVVQDVNYSIVTKSLEPTGYYTYIERCSNWATSFLDRAKEYVIS